MRLDPAGLAFWLTIGPVAAAGQGAVAGRVSVVDRGNKVARDVGRAVVWLESRRRMAVTPDTVEIVMSDKSFRPGVVVIPVGSRVGYRNTDPFNHNVFSLSREGPFDLGLYGRGVARTTVLRRPGILRVYCNVHARMNSFVVVRDNPYYTQPAGDGSFTIPDVPAGTWDLVVWHERARESRRTLQVPAEGRAGLLIELDARGYRPEPHLNKYGKPYRRRGRRY